MPLGSILFWLFVGVVLTQIAYYLAFFFSYVSKPIVAPSNDDSLPISVIICAKNEAKNLRHNLPLILSQKNKNFELVLVNDHSSDESLEVMNTFAEKHQNIIVVDVKHVESFWGNKKYALTLGIKAATKPFLVFTDADCKPRSQNWLGYISGSFSKEKRIILGYGAYKEIKKSWLNLLIRFETLLTAIQYFSHTKLGNPYMGVGRNLAYHKDVFFDNAGFMQHMDIMSGDDDLFINNVATQANVAIMDHPNSVTESEPKKSFSEWIRQKRRHVTTSNHYKPLHRFLLGSFYLSQFGFVFLSVLLLIRFYQWPIVLLLIASRYIVTSLVYFKGSKKLNEGGLFFLSPFLELSLILIQFFIFSANLISKPKHWS